MMDFEILYYWLDFDSLDFDTIFYWARVVFILALIGWLVRRSARRKAARLQAAAGMEGARGGPSEQEMVERLLPGKLRGGEGAPEAAQGQDSTSQMLMDRLPSPVPDHCHIVFLNEDQAWLDIEVRGEPSIAMVGQKVTSLVVRRGKHVITLTGRKTKERTRITVQADRFYCLVELSGGKIQQCCTEEGPVEYEVLRA